MPRLSTPLALGLALLVALAGCGRDEAPRPESPKPTLGAKGDEEAAAQELGFPAFATKNTTRVGGADATADAAAIARAVYSGGSPVTRPRAVALADARDWRSALAASVLMAPPLRAPVLLSQGRELPEASATALAALQPRGARQAGGAQLIRVGDVARPGGLKTTDVRGRDAFAVARGLDALQASARGRTSDRILIVSSDEPAFAMPAAAWAAKSGDPILFVERDRVPPDTRAALDAHQQPHIYVLGPSKVISPKVTRALRRLGTVVRVGGADPIRNAVAFARFVDGAFGWGVVDPGHGLVFARADRTLDAAAAAPLSASGKYGPLLLLDDARDLPRPVEDFLLDIQPGYTRDPVRGVYNHAWIVGDGSAVSVDLQSRLDSLLEIVPVSQRQSQ
jgi:hypothetical protein